MRRLTVALLVISCIAVAAQAQDAILTADRILALKDGGSSDDQIIARIQAEGCRCTVTAIDVMALRSAGASTGLIQAILNAPTPEQVAARNAPIVVPTAQNRDSPQSGSVGFFVPEFRRFEISWLPYSFTHLEGENLHGGSLSFAVHVNDSTAIVAELSAHREFDFDVDVIGYRFGPRFTPRWNRVTTWVQVLAGGASVVARNDTTTIQTSPTTFITITGDVWWAGWSVAAGGGLDVAVNNWFAVRAIQAEYTFGGIPDLDLATNGPKIGTGMVFRF